MVHDIDRSDIQNYITTSSRMSIPEVSIGRLIQDELKHQERTVTWLSRKIHCDRRNIYDIFNRNNIDSNLLMRISMAMGVDFFKVFSDSLQLTINQRITPPQHTTGRNGYKQFHSTPCSIISHISENLHLSFE